MVRVKSPFLIIYGGEVYDKRIEKEVNILYKYIIFNFVYRKYNKKKIIEYFFSFPI